MSHRKRRPHSTPSAPNLWTCHEGKGTPSHLGEQIPSECKSRAALGRPNWPRALAEGVQQPHAGQYSSRRFVRAEPGLA